MNKLRVLAGAMLLGLLLLPASGPVAAGSSIPLPSSEPFVCAYALTEETTNFFADGVVSGVMICNFNLAAGTTARDALDGLSVGDTTGNAITVMPLRASNGYSVAAAPLTNVTITAIEVTSTFARVAWVGGMNVFSQVYDCAITSTTRFAGVDFVQQDIPISALQQAGVDGNCDPAATAHDWRSVYALAQNETLLADFEHPVDGELDYFGDPPATTACEGVSYGIRVNGTDYLMGLAGVLPVLNVGPGDEVLLVVEYPTDGPLNPASFRWR